MENFSIGNALGTGFRVWFKNLPAFLLLSIIMYSPVLIYTYSVMTEDNVFEFVRKVQTWSQFMAVWGLVAQFVISAAIIYGVVQELSGHHASLGASVTKGLGRFFPVLLITILMILALVVGFVLLLVPGFIMLCMWFVAVPASVVEKPGIMGAFRRSSELTKGHRWEIFGILVVLGLMNFAITKMLETTFVDKATGLGDLKTYLGAVMGVSIAFAALQASIQGVTYFLLRREKEGTGADELARVFD